jgi:hypothetical protein
MRRRGSKGWLWILAAGLVLWYVLGRVHVAFVIPLSLSTFLLLVGGAIVVVYLMLKWLVGSRP